MILKLGCSQWIVTPAKLLFMEKGILSSLSNDEGQLQIYTLNVSDSTFS